MPPVSECQPTSAIRARPSPLEWLYLVAGLALVVQYRWIFDDSFVYFRYVDNLLFLKVGLTFNAGEYVEGYSSPLHCLLLICLRSLHLAWPAIVLGIGVAGFVGFWLLAVRLRGALDEARSPARVLNFPLAYLAVNYSVTSFFTAGNEGTLIHVMAAGTALLLARPSSRLASVLVAAAPLVRPELGVSTGLTLAYLWWSTGRFPRLLAGAAVALNGTWLAFRVIYYADLLPNTFYLKTGTSLETGTNLEAGLRYLSNATGPYYLAVVLAVFVCLIAWLRNRRMTAADLALRPRVAMLVIALATGGWTVATGGSAMHYYYLAFPFTLAVFATGGIVERLLASSPPAVGCVAMLAVLSGSFSAYPPALSKHPVTRSEVMATLPSLEVMTDPSFFRHRPEIEDPWPSMAELEAHGNRIRREGYGQVTDGFWCNTLYAHIDVRSVHGFGLTDGVLARVDTPEVKRGHKPALAALAVDLINLQLEAGAVGPGVYTDAIGEGRAPAWMVKGRDTIDVVERKMFNDHDPLENLRLAFRFPPKIEL